MHNVEYLSSCAGSKPIRNLSSLWITIMATIDELFEPHAIAGDRQVIDMSTPYHPEEKIAVNGNAQPPSTSYFQAHHSTDAQPTVPVELVGSEPRRSGQVPTITEATELAAPVRRKSVQFAKPALEMPAGEGVMDGESAIQDEGELPALDRRNIGLFSKFKAFTGHHRTQSNFSLASDSVLAERAKPTTDSARRTSLEGRREMAPDHSEPEAEESPYDLQSRNRRKRMKRPVVESAQSQTVPTSPTAASLPFQLKRPIGPVIVDPSSQPQIMRRSTEPEAIGAGPSFSITTTPQSHSRVPHLGNWKRSNTWLHPHNDGLSGVQMEAQPSSGVETPRPNAFRRLTAFGRHEDGTQSPSPWRTIGIRSQSTSAANWGKMKAGLRAFGRKKKEERRDHAKSAELMAELTVGAPAAIILASHFRRDLKGKRRIPVLLEQLKVRITESRHDKPHSRSDRHLILRIELEYGNGVTRMKWVIQRELRDFYKLHIAYKSRDRKNAVLRRHGFPDAQILPRFPRSVVPYLRGVRGLGSGNDELDAVDEDITGEQSGTEGRMGAKKRSGFRDQPSRRSSLAASTAAEDAHDAITGEPSEMQAREGFSERQRRRMEEFLQAYIRCMMFRPDSNRLCKFLELSALGVRLSGEASYHGKEGLLVIASSKGLDFRRNFKITEVRNRHTPKWFMVRHSYVVYVDSPQDMNIYDVFLVDSDFEVQTKGRDSSILPQPDSIAGMSNVMSHSKHHTLKLCNAERELKLWGKNERIVRQFDESIRYMKMNSIWSKNQRFSSFAPVRQNCFAQWLVDGRDYMWNVSRAISMAKDVIYIHGWWLSPEIYMRRPPAISQKWRLDRLLQRKAEEGVKIFVIVYRNIGAAVPIDSAYTKYSLLDLHPNIFVQRSPNQFRQNTFFWAHHEKICVIDHCLAFVGGIDLCFGRWDTPQHSVSDDKQTGFEPSALPKDSDHCQLWAGKDYSNPRVQDFHDLDKPYEEMYDRSKVARMPWHDVAMQVVGQPARDLSRHFVQRWNYILRQRKTSRPTPFLLPPPDFTDADVELLGLNGTCEVQICRSSCAWSIGYQNKTEHSILTAYCKLIEESEHFVYIENQFFISSCEWEGTKIENTIGDALVARIIQAHEQDEDWRAVILIPLMPGFQNTVDAPDGTSVRLIMSCQYASISRGSTSIFGRLRALDIEPEDYIQFYSLRQWGKLGPNKMLVTEQLYIHAKCMIVDDRMAIIGSANINERSMLGSRDSEVAAVVRDTDMLWSTMNGKPYLVGRFPHTLRMRLMREHLGLDVDEIMDQERRDQERQKAEEWESELSTRQSHHEDSYRSDDSSSDASLIRRNGNRARRDELLRQEIPSLDHDGALQDADDHTHRDSTHWTRDDRVTGNAFHEADVAGDGVDHMNVIEHEVGVGSTDTRVENTEHDPSEQLVHPEIVGSPQDQAAMVNQRDSTTGNAHQDLAAHQRSDQNLSAGKALPPNKADLHAPQLSPQAAVEHHASTEQEPTRFPSATHSTSTTGNFTPNGASQFEPMLASMKRPTVTKDCMRDPLEDTFFLDTWNAIAENNTKIYRAVFRCMPDNEVQSWKEYKEYVLYGERFGQMQGMAKSSYTADHEGSKSPAGPPGSGITGLYGLGRVAEEAETKLSKRMPTRRDSGTESIDKSAMADWAEKANAMQLKRRTTMDSEREPDAENEKAGLETLDEKAELRAEMKQATPVETPGPPPNVIRHDTKEPTDRADDEKPTDHALNDSLIPRKPTVSSQTSASTITAFPTLPPTTGSTPHTPTTPTRTKRSPSAAANGTAPHSTQQPTQQQQPHRRRRGTTRSSRREFHADEDLIDPQDAEALLAMVQGHLITFPYDWLVKEEAGGNWLYSIDQLAPIEI